MTCVRCRHGKADHARDLTLRITGCRLCECDKFGVIQCLDCGVWVGRYIASHRCEHHSAIYWRKYFQERSGELRWLHEGNRILKELNFLLKHPEALQSAQQEYQQAKTSPS